MSDEESPGSVGDEESRETEEDRRKRESPLGPNLLEGTTSDRRNWSWRK
jgi:hypothetical protein